jgi:serine/threonine protein kinase
MKIIEFYSDETKLYIVGEYYNGGDLFEKISNIQNFSEKQAAVIMKQIIAAIHYCHKNSIVHRYLILAWINALETSNPRISSTNLRQIMFLNLLILVHPLNSKRMSS